ncbi:glycoside hydrolase family 5 protein [Butyrivibrio sp. JL13D10]|uniref:glycoside hydrolase family 5 protein n=1 Tax=Butyrivibrio sp. JL13D10 TaxID=3236815 RepID=UPI0038B43FBA
MKKKKTGIRINRFLCLTLICVIMLCIIGFSDEKEVPVENQVFINSMGVGYNIGNALDACDWSTMFTNKYGTGTEGIWGNPAITEEFVRTLAARGFGTVRIPVTYMNHIDGNGNIDPAWLARVGQVANWIIANNMYCIVDIHHDTGNSGWIKATEDNYNANSAKVASIINQIAVFFNGYGDHLILEGFNEMVDAQCHWDNAPAESLNVYNRWNQLFVDTVRATGGNNSSRYLLVNTYASTLGPANTSAFNMPNDSVPNRILVGVHNYYDFNSLDASFANIDKLRRRGYPVVIGEFGATVTANFDRAAYAAKFISLSRQYGFCPIWWDNGQDPARNPKTCFSLYNRNNLTEYYSDILNSLMMKN